MAILDEFRAFALKGNVVDLAVAVVIGAAFHGIITSLVDDIIMPPVGYLFGGLDFSDLFITLGGGDYASLAEAQAAGAATINYGAFINTIVGFLLIALALFLVVRGFNRARARALERPPAVVAEPPPQEVLLAEIRDLLKEGAARR